MARGGNGMKITLSTRNLKGIQAQFYAKDKQVQEAARAVVRKFAERTAQRTYEMCPKDTWFMSTNVEIEYSRNGLAYEVGWNEETFSQNGLRFYPPYVEFGTSRTRAQPSLFPAMQEQRAPFVAEMRRVIEAGQRRKQRNARRAKQSNKVKDNE